MATYRDLINRLPYRLRNRFDSLSGFVKSVIDDHESKLPQRPRLSQNQVRLIQLIVFIHTLDDFLREGTAAARSAAVGFQELGVDGFVVGTTVFSGENENVMRGEVLADRLRLMVADLEVFDAVDSNQGPAQLTLDLWERLQNA